MNTFHSASLLLSIAVGLGYINQKFIKVQTTIAIMSGAMLLSLILVGIQSLYTIPISHDISDWLLKIPFHDLVMDGMLSFLLFAGSLFIDMNVLKKQKWQITTLAIFTTPITMAIIACSIYPFLNWIGHPIPFNYCLIFGALIAPTDPIAVLGSLKECKASKSISMTMAGESLFNDGIGIVIFTTLYEIIFIHSTANNINFFTLFLKQACGGVLYGYLIGVLTYYLINDIKDHKLQIMVTIASVTGGYALAEILEISGPLAMVTAGLFIGNHGGKHYSMSLQSTKHLDEFWEVIDEVLNALLFLLLGLEILIIINDKILIPIMLFAIFITLIARAIAVYLPIKFLYRYVIKKNIEEGLIPILIWGGLRGGLAVALTLSLPKNNYYHILISMSYAVVIFSVIIQGLSIKWLVKYYQDEQSQK
jgi:monovalent cation:H+ antiporter, CPA1 family